MQPVVACGILYTEYTFSKPLLISDHDDDEDLPAASRYGVVSDVSHSEESSADLAAEGFVSSAAAAVEEAAMEDKDGLDTTLTDLLEDVDLEKLEEIMEELLPIEGVKQAAAALAMSTGQGIWRIGANSPAPLFLPYYGVLLHSEDVRKIMTVMYVF